IGTITEMPLLADGYTEALTKAISIDDSRPCQLVIDYASATASRILPQVLNRGGCSLVALNGSVDETRLAHTEDEFEQIMRQLARGGRAGRRRRRRPDLPELPARDGRALRDGQAARAAAAAEGRPLGGGRRPARVPRRQHEGALLLGRQGQGDAAAQPAVQR